jgi:hypothetical protein
MILTILLMHTKFNSKKSKETKNMLNLFKKKEIQEEESLNLFHYCITYDTMINDFCQDALNIVANYNNAKDEEV